MKAYVFPGQGAQFVGMGNELLAAAPEIKGLFKEADEVIGFNLSEIMATGTEDDLRATRVTQPAIYLHSLATALAMGDAFKPDMAAGHSLGEFSALAACGALPWQEGLRLVSERAEAMQVACNERPGTMAAILGMDDEAVRAICNDISNHPLEGQEVPGIVVAANFNSPGQVVISGELSSVEEACKRALAGGAGKAIMLSVGGAFHSPLMMGARVRLAEAIKLANLRAPRCPIYQNTVARPMTDPEEIRQELVAQLTAPVRWSESVRAMIEGGATSFTEVGPGRVLQGLIKKIDRSMLTFSAKVGVID